MKRSRRKLSVDNVIDRGIFRNNQMILFSWFNFIPKTGKGYLKQGLVYCDLCLVKLC